MTADTQPSNSGGSGPRITSRFVLPFAASEIVLISIRRSVMAKPGVAVAMIVVAGGFLKCVEPDLVEARHVLAITQIDLRLHHAVEARATAFSDGMQLLW